VKDRNGQQKEGPRAAKCFAFVLLAARRKGAQNIPESNARETAAKFMNRLSRSGSQNRPACSKTEF